MECLIISYNGSLSDSFCHNHERKDCPYFNKREEKNSCVDVITGSPPTKKDCLTHFNNSCPPYDKEGFRYKLNKDHTFSVFFDGEYIGVIMKYDGDIHRYLRQSIYGEGFSSSVIEAYHEMCADYTRFHKAK
jgi:hypothetical protein